MAPFGAAACPQCRRAAGAELALLALALGGLEKHSKRKKMSVLAKWGVWQKGKT